MIQDMFHNTMMGMTWPEVEKKAREDALVLWPIGVIEEHGYHLPLGTDIYLAMSEIQDLAEVMEEEKYPYIVAPPYYWGTMEVVTKNFPGSFTAAPEHIKGMIFDILESLERAGFRRVAANNVHGDGLHIRAVMEAFKEYNQKHELNVRYITFEDDVDMYGLTGKEDFLLAVPPYRFEDMIDGIENIKDDFDVHAGAFETAFMRESFPGFVKEDMLSSLKPTMLNEEQRGQWQSGREEYNALTPEGHVGDPARSVLIKADMKRANKVIAKQIIEFYSK